MTESSLIGSAVPGVCSIHTYPEPVYVGYADILAKFTPGAVPIGHMLPLIS